MYVARIATRGGNVIYREVGARQQMLGIFYAAVLNVGCDRNTEKAFISVLKIGAADVYLLADFLDCPSFLWL